MALFTVVQREIRSGEPKPIINLLLIEAGTLAEATRGWPARPNTTYTAHPCWFSPLPVGIGGDPFFAQ